VKVPGGPEVLEVAEVESPRPGPAQVLVEVAASGVNFIDAYQRSGYYKKPLPFIGGGEGAGTVTEVGSDVEGIEVGDRVAWCMVDGGGYAEQVVVPAERAVPVPEPVGLDTAAAAMLQGITAQYLCESTFPARAGQTALVHAAAGGVGLLLTQMLAAKGVRVIGTTSTAQKAALAEKAGADAVVRYTETDLAEEVRRLTDGRGVDVVYDGVGQATFDAGLEVLARRGMMVLFGASSGPVAPVDPQTLNKQGSQFLNRPTVVDYTATREELLERAGAVFDQIGDGRLDIAVGGRYPLEEAARAHEELEGRRTTGKLLLLP
jgi:NADPH2:quinone reductase